MPWRGWSSTQILKESVIYFDIQFDENPQDNEIGLQSVVMSNSFDFVVYMEISVDLVVINL